jgi:hypothetical protein
MVGASLKPHHNIELAPGSERRDEFTVDGLLLTDVGGTISEGE